MYFLGTIDERPTCNNRHCGNIMETKIMRPNGSVAMWYCRFCKQELIDISSCPESVITISYTAK